MIFWPFDRSKLEEPLQSKMADHLMFGNRVRKTLYYGEYSDASLPSLSVTDVAVEVLNSAAPPQKRQLDRKYANAVSRRAKISPCTLMMGMLYAERLRQQNSQATKNLSSPDIFLISVLSNLTRLQKMVASKYLYDEGEEEEVYNEDWAKAGVKTVQDINKLEMDFLDLMDWNLFISKEEFLNFVNKVESQIAATKGLARGWLTYSDLETLLNNKRLLEILSLLTHETLKIICACVAAYVLGVSLLLSTSTLASLNYCHSKPIVDPNLAGVEHPTTNCLTSEASCVFSRFILEVPRTESSVFIPIAGRRLRRRNVTYSKLQRNYKISTKKGGKDQQSCTDLEVNSAQAQDELTDETGYLHPKVNYYLKMNPGTGMNAFANFTVSLDSQHGQYLQYGISREKNSFRIVSTSLKNLPERPQQNKLTWFHNDEGRVTEFDEKFRKDKHVDVLLLNSDSVNLKSLSKGLKCMRKQGICIA